jgi:multidrug efflux pump subunit AcrA (membrane-fusion protein)
MKRPVFSTILALAMISFAGWSIASKYRPREGAAPPIDAPTNPYDHDVAGVGFVEPASEVIALAIERGGVVSRVDVVAGQTVKAGAPLLSIDRRNYEAAVAQAEASAAAQEAVIASITQNMVLQQALIRQAQANLDSAEAERTRASKRSLSGDNTERVDTRVLQVIYTFAPKDFPAFVGQQVDIFIKAPARAEVLGRVAMDAHNHSTADVTQRVAADLKE